MRGWMVVPLVWTMAVEAGQYDYYECIRPDGNVAHSVERCAKGERQRLIRDDTPPDSRKLEARGGTVRLESRRGAHFYANILVNGVPLRAMVDTGATTVAISPVAAHRLGLDPRRGVAVTSQTANGATRATGYILDSVELGGNVVRNVTGLVMSQELSNEFDALLGMSFLSHFEVNSDGLVMTLRPK